MLAMLLLTNNGINMKDLTLKETSISKSLNKLKDGVIIATVIVFVAILAMGAMEASVNDRTDMRDTKIEFNR
jgi:hypothetical protein